MKRGWVRVAMVGALLVVGSWWINAAVAPPGWACDRRVTGFDGWPARSTSLEEVLAAVDPREGGVMHTPERVSNDYVVRQHLLDGEVSDDYIVRQYLLDGEIVQEVQAYRNEEGQWGIESVTSC